MRSITFTEFRKRASELITEVERGDSLTLIRRGRPVATVSPVESEPPKAPAWKSPGLRLAVKGSGLAEAILEERESGR